MKRLRTRVPIVAVLVWAAMPLSAAAPAAADYVLHEGRFALRPPQGWSASRDAREDARQKVYGVLLTGPRSVEGVRTIISVAYYPPDNALFKGGAAEFLKRNLESDERFVAPAGETTSPAAKASLAGLPAQRFTRHSHVYLPPGRMDAKAVAVVEEVYAVPAKMGFYVVSLKASERLARKLKPQFNRVLASLRFLDVP